MIYIDTHAHLDDEQFKTEPLGDIIIRAEKAGVKYIIAPATDLESARTLSTYADQFPGLFFAAGMHAHNANKFYEREYLGIKKTLAHEKAVAVGEIGLDFHYNFSPKSLQIHVLERFLTLAEQIDKPVILHCREAEEVLHSMLTKRRGLRGVVHCYTSDEKWAKKFLELGFYLGFTGVITFKKADEIRKVVEMTPIDRILTETDSPYMTPDPHRKIKRNEPQFLPHIANKIAQIKGIGEEEAAEKFIDNARKCFSLPI